MRGEVCVCGVCVLCVCALCVHSVRQIRPSCCLDISISIDVSIALDSIPREPIRLLESPSATRQVPDATRVRSMAHCATRERTRANESVAVASRRVVCSSCLRSCARTRWWGTTSATMGGDDDDDDDDSIRFVRRRDDARERASDGERGFGRPGESWDDAFSSSSSSSGKFWSQTPWQLVESLAKTFLCRSPPSTSGRGGGRRGEREIYPRAWLVDESVDEVADRTTIRATEKEVRLARDADGLKNFELYALLIRHEARRAGGRVGQPTILVDDANLVVVDAIDLDVSENSLNDRCLANYWYSCPSAVERRRSRRIRRNGMCGFESR